jgi:hypothetical protein
LELRTHGAASLIHLFGTEASVLLFPLGDRRQTGAPLLRFARRDGHPGRYTHPVTGSSREDFVVNVRGYSNRKLW